MKFSKSDDLMLRIDSVFFRYIEIDRVFRNKTPLLSPIDFKKYFDSSNYLLVELVEIKKEIDTLNDDKINNHLLTLIDTISKFNEIMDRLDGKTRGRRYNWFLYRKNLKEYELLRENYINIRLGS